MMKKMNTLIVMSLMMALFTGCGKNSGSASDDSPGGGSGTGSTLTGEEASVVIASAISGIIGSSDGTIGEGPATSSAVVAAPCETYQKLPGRCADLGNGKAKYTLAYGGCTRDRTKGVWTGGVELTFENGAACSDPLPPSKMGASVTRTFSPGTNISYDNGFSLVIDTTQKKGYAQQVNGGSTTTVSAVSGDLNIRQVVINGIHISGLQGGNLVWDHTFSTDAAGLMVLGAENERQVTAGTITTQHNIAKYVTTSRITQPLTYKKSQPNESVCCFPTGGTLHTTFEGGKFAGKSEDVKFGPSCGQATVKTVDNRDFSLMLGYCL